MGKKTGYRDLGELAFRVGRVREIRIAEFVVPGIVVIAAHPCLWWPAKVFLESSNVVDVVD